AARASIAALTPEPQRLVAEEDGRIVGTVCFRVDGDLLRVMGLAVLPLCRHRGIARSLVRCLAGIAEERKCRGLGLYTVRQTGNIPIFERLGFRLIAEGPADYFISVTGQPLTEAYMELDVAVGR